MTDEILTPDDPSEDDVAPDAPSEADTYDPPPELEAPPGDSTPAAIDEPEPVDDGNDPDVEPEEVKL